ncbi:hypothetical protein FL966_02415 [Caproiciproducens galactitolivorans]|uniref:Lipoprotein n=1 Tax=Caproiciproducens galactitolivorans TaxID=642589 RepID=A0A4Z0YB69_9FIRM|nr:hypothetical protein [Caproiciproducens galactitolivorans]QEY33991.1 hypothetical protein FL966_02415 [Caproiciproducens galactitolivorans]TGJ76043.1 hypothetical protein CAGA_17640 [Caproiciproducens galactitolivorans]
MKVKTACTKIVSISLVFTLLTACGSQQSSESGATQTESSSQADQGSEKALPDLIGLENNIEMIIKTLNGPAVLVKQGMQQNDQSTQSGQNNASSQENQSSQESQGQQEGQYTQANQSSQQSQGGQQSQPQTSSQPDPMTTVSQTVDMMHYQWNNLMAAAVKKGAKQELINNFSTALNNLSNTVSSKNKMNIMLAANKVYANIPDLYSLFQPKPSPEIKRVRYYSRSAILNSLASNWKQADSDISNLKSVWELYKNSLGKEQQDMANKLDLSIIELEKVVKGKNLKLVDIKGKVMLSNTEALEKAAESGSKGQSVGEQSGQEQSGRQ